MSCYGVSFTLLFWGWFWEVAKLLTALYRVFCYPKNRGRFHRNTIYVPNCTVSWTRGYKSLMNWCLSDERLDRCHTQSASNKISSRVGLSHRWCQHIYRVMSVYIQSDVIIYTGWCRIYTEWCYICRVISVVYMQCDVSIYTGWCHYIYRMILVYIQDDVITYTEWCHIYRVI